MADAAVALTLTLSRSMPTAWGAILAAVPAAISRRAVPKDRIIRVPGDCVIELRHDETAYRLSRGDVPGIDRARPCCCPGIDSRRRRAGLDAAQGHDDEI